MGAEICCMKVYYEVIFLHYNQNYVYVVEKYKLFTSDKKLLHSKKIS